MVKEKRNAIVLKTISTVVGYLLIEWVALHHFYNITICDVIFANLLLLVVFVKVLWVKECWSNM